jgi:prepilin-type N-terminal cleavage/methylation domain-containing protein
MALENSGSSKNERTSGFTLVELLVVVGVIGVLAGILLPTLAKSKIRAQAIFCLNNTRQLTAGWMMYADDHGGRLAYNLDTRTTKVSASAKSYVPMSRNWTDNILDWRANNPDNTNTEKMVHSGIGPYVSESAPVYRCPADRTLSRMQQHAGWTARVRSYSMNGMVGDAGAISESGSSKDNPAFRQFFSSAALLQPADVFLFLDEHPDSIDDGYFVNRAYERRWTSLPASYHGGAACISFTEGHTEMHRWRSSVTMPRSQPNTSHLIPIQLPTATATPESIAAELADFYWVISRMSTEPNPGNYGNPGN